MRVQRTGWGGKWGHLGFWNVRPSTSVTWHHISRSNQTSPMGHQTSPKQKPQHHLSAQTQSNKRDGYELKVDFLLIALEYSIPTSFASWVVMTIPLLNIKTVDVAMTFVIPLITCQMHYLLCGIMFITTQWHSSKVDFYFVNRLYLEHFQWVF